MPNVDTGMDATVERAAVFSNHISLGQLCTIATVILSVLGATITAGAWFRGLHDDLQLEVTTRTLQQDAMQQRFADMAIDLRALRQLLQQRPAMGNISPSLHN